MINTITFESGDKTCAVIPGKFCRFITFHYFGSVPYCNMYQEELENSRTDGMGWTLRCDKCLQEQGVNN